ncbi:MAG: hypothetical protein DCC49_02705 [Acidobacteria bacterium]|nr:MAG: hypothetical protein DCC49_02705 [Acidobacteriota bacterium]
MTGSSVGARELRGGQVALCTVTANNYLGRACVMARSLVDIHPDLVPFVGITDKGQRPSQLDREPLSVISLEDIGLALNELTFGLRREQLAVVAKPALIAHLLDVGFETVVYLDPDMLVCSKLDSVIEIVSESAVTLTPHLLDETSLESEIAILLSGVYNAGFVGVSSKGRGFVDWWLDRTLVNPENDVENCVYYDQRWLDLAPSMFEGVMVLRDRGVNVAYWNMAERELDRREGNLVAGTAPVKILHFSGFDLRCPEQASVHFGGVSADSLGPEAKRVFKEYAAMVQEVDRQLGSTDEYGYGVFKSGEPIPDVARLIYRELGEEAARFNNPFDDTHPSSFANWLNAPALIDEARVCPAITNLWERVYRLRPDVQAAYPDLTGNDREGFVAWTRSSGLAEHGVGEAFRI